MKKYYEEFNGKLYSLTNYLFLNISNYILLTLKYYSDSRLNDTMNTLLRLFSYDILNYIQGRISEELINYIRGVIYIFDANCAVLHLIIELN